MPVGQVEGYSVEVSDRVAELDPADWDGVVTAAGAPVFYTHAYLAAYERDPLAAVDAHAYLVVHRRGAGTPVAVLPLYLQRRPDPLACLAPAYPELAGHPALLTHVWHCYDTHLPTTAADAAPLVGAVLAAMRRVARRLGAPYCGLVNVARGSPTGRALRAAGQPLRHVMDRFAADLRGMDGFEGYLARLGPRARANLRRNARRAAEAGVVTTVVPPDRADLDEVAALCGRTAARFGNTGFYPARTFGRFVRGLGGAAHVLQVRQHGRLVAAGVCLVDSQRFHTWTCGVDYDVEGNFSPYAVLFAESVALALRLGRPVLEGGRSNAVFKQRHGLSVRHLEACVVPA
jgi:predicted N-acyltransferase